MPTKALDLFQAYAQEKLPRDGGYIVSSFFDATSSYSRYEVVAYNGVKGISMTDEGLQFQADGNKIFVLVEPPSILESMRSQSVEIGRRRFLTAFPSLRSSPRRIKRRSW